MRFSLLLFLLVTLSACSTSSGDYASSAPPISLAARTAWWQSLEDPLLNQLATQLQQENLDLQAAEERLKEARAMRRVADADLFPQVDLQANSSRGNKHAAQATQTSDIGFDASWELDLFGKTRAAIGSAAAREQQAVADRDALHNTLLADLARALVEWRQAKEKERVVQSLLHAQDTQIELYAAREKAGLINGSFAERARAQRTQTAVQLPLAQATAVRAQYQIEYLLGLKPHALDSYFTAIQDTAVHVPDVHTLIAQEMEVVRRRPDIRAAYANVEASRQDVAQAEAALWPSVSLGSFFGVQDLSALSAGNPVWSLSAALTSPVLRFGKLKAAIDVADARQAQALLAYQNAVLQALQEIQTDLSDYLNNVNAAATQEQALAQRTTALQLARERFEHGLNDMIDVTTAQAEQESASLNVVDQKAAAAIAFIRLQKALAP